MKRFVRLTMVFILFIPWAFAQSPAPESAGKEPLTIEAIFADGGITGRGPKPSSGVPTARSSPSCSATTRASTANCGTSTRRPARRRCWSAKPNSPAWLPTPARSRTSARKNASLAITWRPTSGRPTPSICSSIPNGQLWIYNLENGTAVQFTSSPDAGRRSQVLARRQPHRLRAQAQSVRASLIGQRRKPAHRRQRREPAERRSGLGVRRGTRRAQQLLLVARRQARSSSCRWMRRQVPTYPITDWLPTHPKVDQEKYPKAGDPNPASQLGVVSAKGGKPKWISLTNDQRHLHSALRLGARWACSGRKC